MKFLVIASLSLKDTVSTLPPSVIRQLIEANLEYVNQARKAGKILEWYHIPGWGRFVSIEEHKSAEEIGQNLGRSPMAAFINFEVYPLADADESMKIMLESIKAAEQRAAGTPK